MPNYIYENHVIKPQLPIIFHTDMVMSCSFDIPNWHRNIELIYCISGGGYVKCNASVRYVDVGDVCVINSDVIHSFSSLERPFIYHCLIIDSGFCRENGIPIENLQFQQLIRSPALAKQLDRLAQRITQYEKDKGFVNAPGIRYDIKDKGFVDVLGIRYDVLGVLHTLCSEFMEGEQEEWNFANDRRVKLAMTFIRENLEKTFTLDEIADAAGISKFHLSREFKRITDMTVFEFVNLTRCTEARRLIESGAKVTEAAEACGYENMSYFTRTFKKQFGVLPSTLLTK